MKGRRTFLMGLSGALTGCLRGAHQRLNVFNWDAYIAPDTIPNFERRYGCKVRYGVYGSAEEMLARVLTGNSGWDVVFPSNSFIQPMREMSLLLELDRKRLPHRGNLHPAMQAPDWDPLAQWCVPFMQSATGILYARGAISRPPDWSDLWTDTFHQRLTMLDDPAENFAAALKRLGQSVNAEEPRALTEARGLMMVQRPLLRAYMNEEVRDQVIAGDVLAAQMWAQVAQSAIANGNGLAFSFPQEGFPLYCDSACILRESKHRELAYAFLDYLLEAPVAAAIAEAILGTTANAGARTLLPAGLRENTVLYPSEETLRRGEWFRPLSPAAQRLRDRYWTEVKAA